MNQIKKNKLNYTAILLGPNNNSIPTFRAQKLRDTIYSLQNENDNNQPPINEENDNVPKPTHQIQYSLQLDSDDSNDSSDSSDNNNNHSQPMVIKTKNKLRLFQTSDIKCDL